MVFEQTTLVPPGDRSAVDVMFTAVQPVPGIVSAPRAVVNAAGSFRFSSVAPGSYVLRAEPPAAASGARWRLKSAMLNGCDLADRPLHVASGGAELSGVVMTFTDRATEVAGRLIDESGQPVTRYSIVVFTSDRSLWLPDARRIRSVQPATDGSFALAGLPAGEYAIAAAENLETSDLPDQAFLEQLLASAYTVTLVQGERKRQDLRIR